MNKKIYMVVFLAIVFSFCLNVYADTVQCSICGGSGKSYGMCPVCYGTGTQIQMQYYNYMGRLMPRAVYVKCYSCGGSGRGISNCMACGGIGYITFYPTPGGMDGGGFNNNNDIEPAPKSSPAPSSPKFDTCMTCYGTGNCQICGGDGLSDSPYTGDYNYRKCSACNGTGKCWKCKGTGKI
jgi:DnaJ-class molecular chaperone